MKIAYDAKRFFHNLSGLGNYSRDLVRIMAHYFPNNAYVLMAKNSNNRGQEIQDLDAVSFSKITSGKFARQLKMGKDAEAIKADVFHGLSGEIPLKWSGSSIKKVVTIHDLIFVHYPQFYSFFDRKIHFWKFKKSAQLADVVIAISEQTKRDIVSILKVPAEKVVVVYQGCHSAFKEEQTEDFLNLTRQKFNLSERFILNVGTIEERKNLFNVVKAIEGTEINLVVVGRKTKYAKKIDAFIKKNKMEAQVLFLQNVSMEELAAVYKLADLFVYPSLFEGFGIPIIEAHFSKTPVITSNVSCLPEAGGDNALYVNPLSVEDLRAKIVFLWENESERTRRSEASLAFAEANFNDEKIANDLMQVYQSLL